MDNKVKIWGIHTPALNDRMFLEDKTIAIGWHDIGDLSKIPNNLEAFREKYSSVYEDAKEKPRKVINDAGKLYKFIHEMKKGDYVVFPSKSNRNINIGIIEGDYYFSKDGGNYPHRRKVKWLNTLQRSSFTNGALYEMGSFLTLFVIKNYSDEILNAINKTDSTLQKKVSEEDETVVTAEEIENGTKDFVLKELNRLLKGYALEPLVENLLNAMGYRTIPSKHGGDRGIDIIAFKDELPPRIIVQVKSQNGDVPEALVQSLKGTLKEGDYGLFVTLSNYKENALKYLEANPIIRGINGKELVDLILEYYDKLDKEYKSMIPLKRAYIPAPEEQE